MRDALVDAHLQHLGVDEDQPHIAGLGLVEQAEDHRVDTHRLARAGGAGHQAVRHLGEVGHNRQADDVLAQAHGQLRGGIGIDLRAEDLGQADGLAACVGQLQRHVVLARDGLDDADGHEAQGARQVLGQVDDLRALHAGGRLDLVARDDRAGRRGDHMHLDAEVAQLLFDQAAGHFQRLGRHGFLAARRGIQQIDLRQLGVADIGKQRLLPLLGDAGGLRHFDHRRFDDERHMLDAEVALQLALGLALDLDLLLARLDGLLTGLLVGLDLALLDALLAQQLDALADALGQLSPRKTQCPGHADQQQHDPHHARAGETQRLHAPGTKDIADQTAGMAARQARLQHVQPAPLQCAACTEQQQDTGPPAQPLAPVRHRRDVMPQQACQAAQPGAQGEQRQPPGRKTKNEKQTVRQPGAQAAHAVADQFALAAAAEGRVAQVVGAEGQHQQPKRKRRQRQPERGAQQPGCGRRRGGVARRSLAAAGLGRGGGFARGAIATEQGTEGKTHAVIVPRRPSPLRRTARAASIVGQAFLDDDRAVLQRLDDAALFQVLHHPADHLARGADDLGHVLARHLAADQLDALLVLGHVEQRTRHPAVHVQQRQRLDLPVGIAQPGHQAAQDAVGQAAAFGQAAGELHTAQHQHVGLHLGAHGGRMRLVVDQAHLADVVAGLKHRQDDLAAAMVGGQHAGAAVEQDEQGVGLGALFDDQFTALEAALDDAIGDGLGLIGGQHREQRNAPNQVQVGNHRHRSSPGLRPGPAPKLTPA
mmetsp:Transcript_42324/g.99403  ORF Transcript_42324/g.99403 Transcript_42324/m.99403 type:complete len:764 (+) Transcript_42324:1851-4142(+)